MPAPYHSQWEIKLLVTEDMTYDENSRMAVMVHNLEHSIPGVIIRVMGQIHDLRTFEMFEVHLYTYMREVHAAAHTGEYKHVNAAKDQLIAFIEANYVVKGKADV